MSETPTKPLRRGGGRVAFLAKKDLFQSLVEQGHPQRSIYTEHASSLGIGYPQFTRYVARFLTNPKNRVEQQNEVSSSSAQPSGAQEPQKRLPGQVGRTFEFNPNPDADGNGDNLI